MTTVIQSGSTAIRKRQLRHAIENVKCSKAQSNEFQIQKLLREQRVRMGWLVGHELQQVTMTKSEKPRC